ncbi:MAG TPA: S9 family peptidase, partial [Phenylobacterium sp.]|nr:S9 family peptidase [Phenylobacterium sp.]
GGSPANLTRSDEASDTGPVFTPDSRAVAFNRRGKTESSTNIALLTLEDRAVRPLTQEKEAGIYWRAVAFTPDGRRLIANRSDAGGVRSSVWSIDVATGAAERLAGERDRGYAAASDVSAEGGRIALVLEDAEGRRQAGILDLATGGTRLLQPGPWPQATTRFSPDGASLLFAANVDGRDEVLLYDLRAAKAEKLALPEGVNSDFFGAMPAFSPDGTRILFPHSSGSTPTDWWIYDRAAAAASPLTRLNVASIKPAQLPRTQVVRYRSRDGLVISALLWMPFNLPRDGSAPAVVIAHGGPTAQTQDRFDQTAVALASRGYVVIAPNVRGSTGYGRAFEEANRRDLGGGDLEDEANAARFLVQSGYVDPKRIGITGGSYGGYMTVMALAKMPDFWAAGVEQYGIVNWNTMWERGSPALREYQRMLIGDPVKDKAVYAAVSPLTFLGNVRSPLLVLQGENDIRVPKYEAEQIVQRLKAKGATVEATYYPGEGHGFLKRENQIDALERTVAWFEQHLKPARP